MTRSPPPSSSLEEGAAAATGDTTGAKSTNETKSIIIGNKQIEIPGWDTAGIRRVPFSGSGQKEKEELRSFLKKEVARMKKDKDRAAIETVFLTGIPSGRSGWRDFFNINCGVEKVILPNLKTLVISLGMEEGAALHAPIDFLSDVLRASPQLETFHCPTYLRLEGNIGDYAMGKFCYALRSHPSLTSFQFLPIVPMKNEREQIDWDSFEDYEVTDFSVESVLKALAGNPNLRNLTFRPSVHEFQTNDEYEPCREVSYSALVKLCNHSNLSELSMDFRSERTDYESYSGKTQNYCFRKYYGQRTDTGSSKNSALTVALEKSALTKFSYRYSYVESSPPPNEAEQRHSRSNDEVPIILDALKAMKNNTSMEHLFLEQRNTQQYSGIVSTLSTSLSTNCTLVELNLPGLQLCDNDDEPNLLTDSSLLIENATLRVLNLRDLRGPDRTVSKLIECIVDWLKPKPGTTGKNCNCSLQVLDLRGRDCKEAFQSALISTIGVSSNTSLIRLESGIDEEDYDCWCYNCVGCGGGEDDYSYDRSAHCACQPINREYVPNVDLALLLNNAGRGRLNDTSKANKSDFITVLANVPKIWKEDNLDEDYYDDDDDPEESVVNQEELEVLNATYYLLRQYPNYWAIPKNRNNKRNTNSIGRRSAPAEEKKKMKRTTA